MTEETTAARVLDVLEAAGVTTAFGLPGVHNLPFWDDVDESGTRGLGLRIVSVRHEQTAAYAGDGLARASGGLGVAVVTSGPGAANTLAAFGEAAASGVPLLVIASDVPERHRDRSRVRGLLHESKDPGAWFAPMAKAIFQPTTPAAAVEAAVAAVETAMAQPRGPVYLGIPSDVLAAPAPPPSPLDIPDPDDPTPGQIVELADAINASHRPLLWVGGGAVASGATAAIDALAWRLGAPVICTYAGRGTLLANPEWADLSEFAGVTVLAAAEPWGASVLDVNGTLVIPSSYPKTKALLESKGFTALAVDLSELQKAEGGPTCLSLLFTA